MLCALIMAGGQGERFWPLSTEEKPKQFLNLLGPKSMLQITVERMQKLISLEKIFIVTGERYVKLIKEQIPNLPQRNIIIEPVGRNTAPCVALSALVIEKYYEASNIVVVPSDHLVVDEEKYLKVIKEADKFIDRNEETIVTIGIEPDRAETGYGYMKFDVNEKQELLDKLSIYKVIKFVEKPDVEKAERYIKDGSYIWNSGIFIWKSNHILKLTKKYLKNTFKILDELSITSDETFNKVLKEKYEFVDNISVDYGIMENAKNIYVIPSSFGWDDIGTWKAVERYRQKDINNNVCVGDIKNIESSNNIIMGNSKPIVVVGLNDIFVAETDKVIFVGNKQYIDNIKEIKTKLQN